MSNQDAVLLMEGAVKLRKGNKWKQRWCVLRRLSPVADLLTLEFRKESKKKVKTKVDSRDMKLKSECNLECFCGIISGLEVHGSQNCLIIICMKNLVMLSFETKYPMVEWEIKIRQVFGEEHQFLVNGPIDVNPRKKKKQKRGKAHAPAIMCLHNNHFALTALNQPKIVGVWELDKITRYGPTTDGFVFESNFKKHSDKRIIMVETPSGDSIANAFDLVTGAQNEFTRPYPPNKFDTNSANRSRGGGGHFGTNDDLFTCASGSLSQAATLGLQRGMEQFSIKSNVPRTPTSYIHASAASSGGNNLATVQRMKSKIISPPFALIGKPDDSDELDDDVFPPPPQDLRRQQASSNQYTFPAKIMSKPDNPPLTSTPENTTSRPSLFLARAKWRPELSLSWPDLSQSDIQRMAPRKFQSEYNLWLPAMQYEDTVQRVLEAECGAEELFEGNSARRKSSAHKNQYFETRAKANEMSYHESYSSKDSSPEHCRTTSIKPPPRQPPPKPVRHEYVNMSTISDNIRSINESYHMNYDAAAATAAASFSHSRSTSNPFSRPNIHNRNPNQQSNVSYSQSPVRRLQAPYLPLPHSSASDSPGLLRRSFSDSHDNVFTDSEPEVCPRIPIEVRIKGEYPVAETSMTSPPRKRSVSSRFGGEYHCLATSSVASRYYVNVVFDDGGYPHVLEAAAPELELRFSSKRDEPAVPERQPRQNTSLLVSEMRNFENISSKLYISNSSTTGRNDYNHRTADYSRLSHTAPSVSPQAAQIEILSSADQSKLNYLEVEPVDPGIYYPQVLHSASSERNHKPPTQRERAHRHMSQGNNVQYSFIDVETTKALQRSLDEHRRNRMQVYTRGKSMQPSRSAERHGSNSSTGSFK